MAKYYLTHEAVDDLSAIWNYTYDTWSEKQADAYYLLQLDTCQDLAKNPSLGKSYDIVSQGILGYKTGEHIIFYQLIAPQEIEVIRILNGMMDLKKQL